MRCDVNLSLKPKGSKELGKRTEMKNLNSFKMVARAIEYEAKRQAEILNDGGKITTETRRWDEAKGKTLSMRSKEEAQDYRYFPDPDIYPVKITSENIKQIKDKMPPLAYELKGKFIKEFGLPEYDAIVLTKTRDSAYFYLDCVALLNEPKIISNWTMVDLARIMNAMEIETIPVSPKHLTEIIKMVQDKTVTKTVGLQLLEEIIKKPTSPMELAKKMGLLDTVTDAQILESLENLKKEKPNLVTDYLANKQKVLPFIIGQVMKQTRGKAKSEIVEKLISKVFHQ